MTTEELTAIRSMLQEELGASEQRTNEKLDSFEQRTNQRFDRVESRLDHIETKNQLMGTHLILITSAQRQLQNDFAKMQVDQQQVLSILEDVVTQIGDLKSSQIALETKVSDNIGSLRRDVQSLEKRLVARMDAHENTPLDRAHPRFYPPTA